MKLYVLAIPIFSLHWKINFLLDVCHILHRSSLDKSPFQLSKTMLQSGSGYLHNNKKDVTNYLVSVYIIIYTIKFSLFPHREKKFLILQICSFLIGVKDRLGLWCLTSLSKILWLYSGSFFLLVQATRVPKENHGPTIHKYLDR